MGIISLKKSFPSQPTMAQRIQQQKKIQIGLKFMSNQGVEVIPPTVKKIFLQKKGLREQEIQKVFRLHEEIKQKRFKETQKVISNQKAEKQKEKIVVSSSMERKNEDKK